MLVTPAFAAMTHCKKDVSDMTRRGLNPIGGMSKSTQSYAKGIFQHLARQIDLI